MNLTRDGDVFVLDLGDTENRFHPDWLAQFNDVLDRIEATEGPKALVTTATGKFWSNGLDLEWLSANPGEVNSYLTSVHALFARVLAWPVPAIAALQGHCFAGGAMIALGHDFRVMRADRGYFCLPEVDLGLPFTPGMNALVTARLPQPTAHEAMTTGRRYGGNDALTAGIVDAVADEDKVLRVATDMAQPLAGKAGPTLGTIKARMYEQALRVLRDEKANSLT